jgi:hypothetical protein
MNAVKFRRNSVGRLCLDNEFVRRDRSKDQPAREINDGRAAKKIISYVGCIFDMDSLIFRNSELCSQFFEQKLAFERKQIYSDYLRRQ